MGSMSTKRESYELSKPFLPRMNDTIVTAIASEGGLTRSEIAARTGIRLSSVCASVNLLIKEGVLQITGRRFDEDTERNVQVVDLAG